MGQNESQDCLLLAFDCTDGQVQVKRSGHPLPTRQVSLQASDVIEWQIAYHDSEGQLVELGSALQMAYQHALIGDADIDALRESVERQQEFFDERFGVKISPVCGEFCGFQLHWRKHPVLRSEVESGVAVEIELRHRQRAVGFQSMVFLLIPLGCCEPADVLGRKAKPKECVLWSLSPSVLKGLVKAFAIASRSHRNDMLKLLERIKEG